MAIFGKKCSTCGKKNDGRKCLFCKMYVCNICLKPLILKENTPVWFVGKEVNNFLEYTKLNVEYCDVFKKRGVTVHCCNEYLKQAWAGIVEQVKAYLKGSNLKLSKITLK